jgi:hypothetical protein
MKIVLNEKQIDLVKDTIKQEMNEAIGFGFSSGYLKTLPTFAAKLRYCREYLGEPIGKGSSRVVFQLDDEWVLKLAINAKGIAQNEHEGQPDYYKDGLSIFPNKNYELSDLENYTFIVSEYVLPAKQGDFKKCLGVDFQTFCGFIGSSIKQFERRYFGPSLPESQFEDLIENSEYFNELYQYICDYQDNTRDAMALRNLGMAMRDGEPVIVILDSGLSEDIYNQYYRRKG